MDKSTGTLFVRGIELSKWDGEDKYCFSVRCASSKNSAYKKFAVISDREHMVEAVYQVIDNINNSIPVSELEPIHYVVVNDG